MNTTLKDLIRLEELMQQSEDEGCDTSLRCQIDRLRIRFSKSILRQFDHLAELGRLPVARVSESGACGSCHMKLPAADLLHIRNGAQRLPICPFCGCFLYSPGAVVEPKELTEAGP